MENCQQSGERRPLPDIDELIFGPEIKTVPSER